MGTLPQAPGFLLAQASSDQAIGPFLLWVGAFIAIITVAGLALLAYRRRMLGTRDAGAADGMMEQLRQMHREGRVSQEEYDAARKAIVGRMAGAERAAPTTRRPAPRTEGLTAKPGFDLTGAPLPPAPPPDTKPPPTA